MNESKPIVLRSVANPVVRHIVRMRDNRHRRRAGRVLVDGWRETSLALQAGLTLRGIFMPYLVPSGMTPPHPQADDNAAQVMRHAEANGLVHWVSETVMDRISYGQSPRGVVAEFDRPVWTLQGIQLPESPLILILDRIEKPGNIGAIFRSADAAGVDAILLCQSGDPFNPNAIRSSLGAVFHVPLAAGSQGELTSFLAERRIATLAARVESSTPLWQTDLTGPTAVVLGSEAAGIGARWQSIDGTPVSGLIIPMSGNVDSLNVSISAALIAFETKRQRSSQA